MSLADPLFWGWSRGSEVIAKLFWGWPKEQRTCPGEVASGRCTIGGLSGRVEMRGLYGSVTIGELTGEVTLK